MSVRPIRSIGPADSRERAVNWTLCYLLCYWLGLAIGAIGILAWEQLFYIIPADDRERAVNWTCYLLGLAMGVVGVFALALLSTDDEDDCEECKKQVRYWRGRYDSLSKEYKDLQQELLEARKDVFRLGMRNSRDEG